MSHVRLPSLDCPVCGAKHILFAENAEAKNETSLTELQPGETADCVILCPKCHKPIAVHRHLSSMITVPILGRVTA